LLNSDYNIIEVEIVLKQSFNTVKIQELKLKIDQLLSSGFQESNYTLDFIAKVRMLNFVCLIGIVNLAVLGTAAIIQDNLTLGIFDYSTGFFLAFIILYLRKTHRYALLSTTGVIIAGVLYVFLFISGGVSNTAHLWYYTFPLFAFFLLDSKKGTIATSILLIISIMFYLFQDSFPTLTKYSSDFMIRFVPSFLVVFLYSYIFERTKEKVYNIVNNKNKELAVTIEKLERNEAELKKLHNELENRVIERTSALKEANEKLVKEIALKNEATQRAEAALKMKTEFLTQMSHEIRTPINSILSYTQLLKEETVGKIPEDLEFSFDMINNGGRRLIRTIDLILNMSEVQTGTYEVIKEESKLINDILLPLIGEFNTAAKAKNLELFIVNKTNEEDVLLEVDTYTETQIYANLIDNAIKYTDRGKVQIIVYKNEFNYCVDVKDTGIGICEKYQSSLFDPFTQEEQGYTRKFEGNGLGMALVKEYCNLNNIKISFTSKKGNGTVFRLEFLTDSKIEKFTNKDAVCV